MSDATTPARREGQFRLSAFIWALTIVALYLALSAKVLGYQSYDWADVVTGAIMLFVATVALLSDHSAGLRASAIAGGVVGVAIHHDGLTYLIAFEHAFSLSLWLVLYAGLEGALLAMTFVLAAKKQPIPCVVLLLALAAALANTFVWADLPHLELRDYFLP